MAQPRPQNTNPIAAYWDGLTQAQRREVWGVFSSRLRNLMEDILEYPDLSYWDLSLYGLDMSYDNVLQTAKEIRDILTTYTGADPKQLTIRTGRVT